MKILNRFAFRRLDWDTEQLGVSSALIDASGLDGQSASPALYGRIKKTCEDEKDAGFITIKLPECCPETVNALIRMGASLIDTELVFRYSKGAVLNDAKSARSGLRFLFCREYPAERFMPLAGEMRLSRFFLDPRIPETKALRLWQASIRNHCDGTVGDELLVALYKREPCGIIMLKFKGRRRLFLHVVGVLKEFRGKRIAVSMLSEAAKAYSGSHDIFVETSSRNMPARTAYQRSGFTQYSLAYILHYWRR